MFHHPWEMRAGLCGVTKAGVTSSATPCRDQGLLASHPSHPHLCFPPLPSSPPLPIPASSSLAFPAAQQSWAVCWLPETRGAARLIPRGFPACFPADRSSWHFLAVPRKELPCIPSHGQTHCPQQDRQPAAPEGPSRHPAPHPGGFSLELRAVPGGLGALPVPGDQTGLGRGRESPRPFIAAGEVTWLRIFVPVSQLEKLKHRGAGPHPALTPIPAAPEP